MQVEKKVKTLSESPGNADGIRARAKANRDSTKKHTLDDCGSSIQSLPSIEKADGAASFGFKVSLECCFRSPFKGLNVYICLIL